MCVGSSLQKITNIAYYQYAAQFVGGTAATCLSTSAYNSGLAPTLVCQHFASSGIGDCSSALNGVSRLW